jgi:battenin
MLSAAHDILTKDEGKTNTTQHNETVHNRYDCNEMSTGTVLLANILPGMFLKLTATFFVHKIKYPIRVVIVASLSATSFLIVALTPSGVQWLAFVGIMFASLSASFGEITFLSLTTTYNQIHAISGWSSGTGMAHLAGSLIYAGLTSIGVSPRDSILIMLIIPVLMLVTYACLPNANAPGSDSTSDVNNIKTLKHKEADLTNDQGPRAKMSVKQRLFFNLQLIRPLLKYMIPLFFVYFAEYFINMGLFELLYFNKQEFFVHKDQYRWYNVCYQLAVFISRSSISFVKIKFLPLFPVLQLANVVFLLFQIFYGFAPIWIVFLVIFWEGLLGGGCYVNAFYLVSVDTPKSVREFSIAITSLADTIGIALAGFVAIPIHNIICSYGRQ